MSEDALHVPTLVIGGGVVGAAIAAELHRHGDEVHLVDAGIPGQGVSGISFAWVNARADKTPEAYRRLNLRGLEAHHRLHEAGAAPWFHPSGALSIGRAEIGSAEDLDGRLPVELLGPTDVADRHPELAGHVETATWHAREGWLDVGHMVHDLTSALPAGRVRAASPVRSLARHGRGPGATARLADGTVITAERVVLAAGNGTPELLAGVAPGLAPLDASSERSNVGLTVETYPVDDPPATILMAPGVSVRATRTGGLMLSDHATAVAHEITDPTLWQVPSLLVERAQDLIPGIGAIRIHTVRAGARVWPRDGRTVAGWVADGIYTVLTHSGVTLAAHLAECTRLELAGGTVPELAEFRPDRFLTAD